MTKNREIDEKAIKDGASQKQLLTDIDYKELYEMKERQD